MVVYLLLIMFWFNPHFMFLQFVFHCFFLEKLISINNWEVASPFQDQNFEGKFLVKVF